MPISSICLYRRGFGWKTPYTPPSRPCLPSPPLFLPLSASATFAAGLNRVLPSTRALSRPFSPPSLLPPCLTSCRHAPAVSRTARRRFCTHVFGNKRCLPFSFGRRASHPSYPLPSLLLRTRRPPFLTATAAGAAHPSYPLFSSPQARAPTQLCFAFLSSPFLTTVRPLTRAAHLALSPPFLPAHTPLTDFTSVCLERATHMHCRAAQHNCARPPRLRTAIATPPPPMCCFLSPCFVLGLQPRSLALLHSPSAPLPSRGPLQPCICSHICEHFLLSHSLCRFALSPHFGIWCFGSHHHHRHHQVLPTHLLLFIIRLPGELRQLPKGCPQGDGLKTFDDTPPLLHEHSLLSARLAIIAPKERRGPCLPNIPPSHRSPAHKALAAALSLSRFV